jgi:hypothetical protein
MENSKTKEKKLLQPIHSDYEPTELEVVVHERKRNRQKDFERNSGEYVTDINFKKIIKECKNYWTIGEILREDKPKSLKSYCELCSDLDLEEICPDQAFERVFQLCAEGKISEEGWTLVCICMNHAVIVAMSSDGSRRPVINARVYLDYEMVKLKALSNL